MHAPSNFAGWLKPFGVISILVLGTWAAAGAPATSGAPRAFEVGPDGTAELPRGKEADGIPGDFILRNARIEALVSGNFSNRRANMTTNYRIPTPGCLYDLSVRGSGNDQLTCFAPGHLEGFLSSVRLIADGSGGTAVVRAERTAALGKGIELSHEYRLEEDWPYLLVLSTYVNHGKGAVKVNPTPELKGLLNVATARGITYGDAMDPMDRQGYAYAPVELGGEIAPVRETSIPPGKSAAFALAIAPGHSPAEAFGVIARLRGPTGTLAGRITESKDAPVTTAAVQITVETLKQKNEKGAERTVVRRVPAYPHADGSFEVQLPPGSYEVSIADLGRPAVERQVTIEAGKIARLDVEMEPASRVRFEVADREGKSLPCKAQFLGIEGTSDPNLGVNIRARGCSHQYHSETGRFSVQVPPGKYRVVVTHGIEYSHHESTITLAPGREVAVHAVLERAVDTRGWVSTDFHNHSTPSGDNYCGTDDRIINLGAEQVEFAPTTEHNRFYDWKPHISKLGLGEEIATVAGIELTGPGAHLNAFPLTPAPFTQDNGAPAWVEDPRINALVLREFGGGGPDRWVHLNHPSVGQFFRDRNNDGVADGGWAGLAGLIDAAEVWSTEILNLSPTYEVTRADGTTTRIENRTFAWLQLLNQGVRMNCIAVSDAHAVFGNGVGGWRTYIPSSTDRPAEIDYREIIRNAKAGRMMMTNGPFLEARLEDGTLPGGTTRATGSANLQVRIQTTTWIDIDRVQILVNGRAPADLNFTPATHPAMFQRRGAVRFEASIPVPLPTDAHLIAVAYGEAFDLSLGYGRSWQSGMHPCAFTNPIYIDADGGGFQPNGDTLGHRLPVGTGGN